MRVALVALAIVLVCGAGSRASATTADAPHVQQRVVFGQSIGKVAVGMTLKQVRRALGAPEGVIETRKLGVGKTWTEYSWNLTEWRVAFINGRVVSIGTSIRTERTKEGIGVGTPGSRVERTYGAQCRAGFDRESGRFVAQWCIVTSLGGGRTGFVLGLRCKNGIPKGGQCVEGGGWLPPEVFWIYVFARGESLPVRLG